MNDGPIILITALVMVGGGVGIFFYWRRTYGVWAGRGRAAPKQERSVVVNWSDQDPVPLTTDSPRASNRPDQPGSDRGPGRAGA